MIEDQELLDRITELTLASLDGSIGRDEFAEFQHELKSSQKARFCFLECLALCISLNQCEEKPVNLPFDEGLSEIALLNNALQSLAENEKMAATMEIEKPPAVELPVGKIHVAPQPRHVSKFSIYTLVLSAAAILMVAIFLRLNPPEPAVAFLLESRNAVWSGGDIHLDNGAGIKPGPISLTSGYADIVLTNGVEVVLRGPVTINIESENQVFLLRGSIFSKVPKSVNEYLVRTSGATIVDYGTEFAVEVDRRGMTAAHVFKGEVELRAGPDIVKHGPATRLLAKQAASVDANGRIEKIPFSPERYVTAIPSIYDIDAYVRGGDSANENYGLEAALMVKNDSVVHYSRETYLRFNYEDRGTGPVQKATLTLTPMSVQKGRILRIRLVKDDDDIWSEEELTWGTKLPSSGLEVTFSSDNLTYHKPYIIDVTALLNQNINKNSIATFHIDTLTQSQDGINKFASREHETAAFRPKLTVTFATP